VTEATSTGTEATATGSEATATVAEFTSTGSEFTPTGCYGKAFKTVANTFMIEAASNRHK